MKKYSLILGLVLSLSLTGCNFNKLPRKQKYKNEVTHAEFDEAFEKALGDDSELFPEDEQPDLKSIAKITSNTTRLWKDSAGSQLGKGTGKVEFTQEGQYDGETNVSKVKNKGTSTTKITLGEATTDQKETADYTRLYQVQEVEGSNKTISVNDKAKENRRFAPKTQ